MGYFLIRTHQYRRGGPAGPAIAIAVWAALSGGCRPTRSPTKLDMLARGESVYLALDARSAWNAPAQLGEHWGWANRVGAACLSCRVARTCDGQFLIATSDATYPWGGLLPISGSTTREVREAWQRYALPGNPSRAGPIPLTLLLRFAAENGMHVEVGPLRPEWMPELARLARAEPVITRLLPAPAVDGTGMPDPGEWAFSLVSDTAGFQTGLDPLELFARLLQAGTEPCRMSISHTAVLDTLVSPSQRPRADGPDLAWAPPPPAPVIPPAGRLSSLLAAEFPSGRLHAENLVTVLGEAAAKPLLDLAAQPDVEPVARANAIWALGWLQDDAIGRALRELTGDSEPRVRTMACYALGLRGDDIAVPVLEGVLRDTSRLESHASAAWALGVLQAQEAGAALVEYLSRELRGEHAAGVGYLETALCHAALALGRLNQTESVPLLQQALLKGGFPRVRRAARTALIAMPFDRASQVLGDSLLRDDLTVAGARDACQALARRSATRELAPALTHNRPEVAAEAARAILQIGKPAVPTLREMLGAEQSVLVQKRLLVLLGLLGAAGAKDALPTPHQTLASIRQWARARSDGWPEEPTRGLDRRTPPLNLDDTSLSPLHLRRLRQCVGQLRESHITVARGRDVPPGSANGDVQITLRNPLGETISGEVRAMQIAGAWSIQPNVRAFELPPGRSETVAFTMQTQRAPSMPRLPVIASYINVAGAQLAIEADCKYAIQAMRASRRRVDGLLTEWPKDPLGRLQFTGQVIRTRPGRWGGADDSSAQFWVAYDDRDLHLAVAVTDDRIVRRSGPGDMGPCDLVEFCMVLDGHVSRLRVGPPALTGEDVISTPLHWRDGSDYRAEVRPSESGYTVEMSVSWWALRNSQNTGVPSRLGFDVAVHDVDEPGRWKSCLIWGGDGKPRRNVPSTGVLELR